MCAVVELAHPLYLSFTSHARIPVSESGTTGTLALLPLNPAACFRLLPRGHQGAPWCAQCAARQGPQSMPPLIMVWDSDGVARWGALLFDRCEPG